MARSPSIAIAVGEESARAILTRHAKAIENTDDWQRLLTTTNVRHLLDEHPERFGELYLEAYHVLDDPKAVELFRKTGYDGAIYRGSGFTRDNAEYRVFHPQQVAGTLVTDPMPATDRAGPAEEELTDCDAPL